MKVVYFFFLLLMSSVVIAQKPGTLDKSFGRNGRQYDTTGRYAAYPALLVQPDDKILVGGQGFLKGSGIKTFRIDRALKNGQPDFSFGDSGTVLVKFALSKNEIYYVSTITCMALQPDGKILAGGYYAKKSFAESDFIVLRFLTNGGIDSSFGTNGIAKPKVKGYTSNGNAMLVQPDGKIVIGGTYTPVVNDDLFFIERLLPNGSLDAGFGDSGQIINTYGTVNALALQPDGKIIAAGSNGKSFSYTHMLIRRYLPDGKPDKHFGKGGTVDTTLGVTSFFSDVALQPDGKLVLAGGSAIDGNYPFFAVARYTKSGTPDAGFGDNGFAVNTLPNGTFSNGGYCKRVLLSGNRIILAGERYIHGAYNSSDLVMIGYRPNGSVDSSFAANGVLTANYEYSEFIGNAALQSDQKILLSGTGRNDGQTYEVRNLLQYYGYSSEPVAASYEKENLSVTAIASSLRVYPNPAGNYVIVNGLQAGSAATITISDGLGKMMAVYYANHTSQYRCDISKLTAGVYYVHMKTDDKMELLKFVKQ